MIDWREVRHFRRAEFGHSGDVEPCPELVRILDEAREAVGRPFVINSGIRTPERNRAVGGSETSSHLTGHAVDIRCPDVRFRFLALRALIDAGAERIGIGRTFIHVDTDPGKSQEVIWLYD